MHLLYFLLYFVGLPDRRGDMTMADRIILCSHMRFPMCVTRPNYSGKSVYMSQVSLVVILAQIGSAVPAQRATVTLMHGINSRVNSFESVSHGQSSFFGDASQVSAMFSRDAKRCFNLIDEFGKGTSEIDGAALMASTLNELWSKAVENESITLCATHFTDIIKEQFVPMTDARFQVFSMQAVPRHGEKDNIPEDDGDFGGRLVINTYRLLKGVVYSQSMALQCALDVGVPKFLLSRAAHIEMAVCGNDKLEVPVMRTQNNPRMLLLSRQVRDLHSERHIPDNAT